MSDLVPTGFESIDGPGTEPASALPVQDRPASLFRNTTQLAARIDGNGFIAPGEGMMIGMIVGIETDVNAVPVDCERGERIDDRAMFVRSVY
ncbi:MULTISPECIES: hypothetical protein [Sphingobium]|uniref:hypothetical protein n=1 Tax=Sphingobium TaxID=165695 RepID=UPI0011226B25|nr:hypothetical protein [Sphingobium sp. GW456-12-10-14-TSB1]